MKLNVVKVLSIVSTVIGIGSSVLSGVSQDKMIKETIKKEVEKALQNQK